MKSSLLFSTGSTVSKVHQISKNTLDSTTEFVQFIAVISILTAVVAGFILFVYVSEAHRDPPTKNEKNLMQAMFAALVLSMLLFFYAISIYTNLPAK